MSTPDDQTIAPSFGKKLLNALTWVIVVAVPVIVLMVVLVACASNASPEAATQIINAI
jgi:hypothetical protein